MHIDILPVSFRLTLQCFPRSQTFLFWKKVGTLEEGIAREEETLNFLSLLKSFAIRARFIFTSSLFLLLLSVILKFIMYSEAFLYGAIIDLKYDGMAKLFSAFASKRAGFLTDFKRPKLDSSLTHKRSNW